MDETNALDCNASNSAVDPGCSQSCLPPDVPEFKEKDSVLEAANRVASLYEADVLLYVGQIRRGNDVQVRRLVLNRKNRAKNVFLVMCTSGGDADVAYLIAKCLQCNYKMYTFFVSGFCKSAGTIVAIGAHELQFSQYGELGPLDVQLLKKDELGGRESGRAVASGLDNVIATAFDPWSTFFWKIQREIAVTGRGQLSVGTAATIAANLTVGLLAPISSQVSPMYLGEVDRALSVAKHYGEILDKVSQNLQPGRWDAMSQDYQRGGLATLIEGYPSHGFAVDQHQATELFYRVKCSFPGSPEEELRKALGNVIRWEASFQEPASIRFLSNHLSINKTKGGEDDANNVTKG